MGKVLRYLKPYWKTALLAVLLMTVEVVADLAQPTLMASIVDRGIKEANLALILQTGIWMIAVTLVGMAGGVGCTIFSSITSQRFSADLRSDTFRRVQSFSFDGLDQFKTASLITRLTNDVMQVQNLVLAMLRIMVRAPLLSLGGIIMALALNARLASILLVTLPVLAVGLAFVMAKGFPLFGEVQKRLDGVSTVIRENLAGVRVIKAFVRSQYEEKRFGEANDRLTRITMTASRLVGLTMPLMFLVMNMSVVAVVWYGGKQVNLGGMQVGQVMAFITYMTQILFSLMMVAFMLMMVSRAKASADRIAEVLEIEGEPGSEGFLAVKAANASAAGALSTAASKSGHGTAEPAFSRRPPSAGARVDFQGVSFRYAGAEGAPVLREVSFTAMPGQSIGILGSTGSGKSTLVNLIPRFYEANEGRILIDGEDVRRIGLDELRNRIGIALQESILFTGSIRDNLRWGREDSSDEELVEAARAAQAHEFIERLPEGYETILGQRGVNLSGGQKQRLAIARALVRKPAVLILDDSTSAVDMGTEARLQAELKKMSGTTCFIIAQRVSSVMDADKILVLEDGKIIDTGTHEELLRSSEVYRDIYYSQVGEEAV